MKGTIRKFLHAFTMNAINMYKYLSNGKNGIVHEHALFSPPLSAENMFSHHNVNGVFDGIARGVSRTSQKSFRETCPCLPCF